MRYKRTIFTVLLMIFVAINAYADDLSWKITEYEPYGPLPVKNQMPLYIYYLNFSPDKAQVLDQGKFSWDLGYQVSNGVLDKVTTGTEEYIIQIDTEITRVNLDLRYGIYENLEVGLDIPYIVFSRGYLDGFIENFEETFHFTTPGARDNSDRHDYKYEVRKDGAYLIRSEKPHSAFGDSILSLKYKLLDEYYDEPWPTFSVKAALKIPTGSKSDLTGNEEWEAGISLLADKSFTDRWFCYVNLNTAFIQKPSFFADWNMDSYILSGTVATEFFFTKELCSVLQLTANTTPYPESGTDPLDNNAYDVAWGFNYKFKDNIEGRIYATENLETDSSPDFGLGGGLKIGW